MKLTCCMVLVLGGLAAWLRRAWRVEPPIKTQQLQAWAAFPAQVEEEQRRRLALAADSRLRVGVEVQR